ncbi:hypothetical protein [Streptomyces boninensis]|uniref:hypothetical protein n=1 Tax=Streptomyces boninensis TaxID=2039455 RepID=UPI003B217C21
MAVGYLVTVVLARRGMRAASVVELALDEALGAGTYTRRRPPQPPGRLPPPRAAKKVIAWARGHAEEYGADPAAGVFVTGSSAGGHMAALAALTPNEAAYQPGFEDADTSVTTALRSVSTSPVIYVELPGAHHAFDLFHSFRFEALIDGIEDFAAWVREGSVGRIQ